MVYILLFTFFVLLSFLTQVKLPKEFNALVFILINIVLIAFVGLRGDIDPDYSNYLNIFTDTEYGYSNNRDIEFGYYIFNRLVLYMGWSFQVVIFTMAVLSIVGKTYFFARYSPNFGLSILIYFCTLFFLFDFIAIRQAVALSAFMISLPFIYQRRIWPFLAIMLLASQIHVSSVLLIPGYFLFHKNFSKFTLLGIIAVCAVLNIMKVVVPLVEYGLSLLPIPGGSAEKVAIYLAENEYAFVSVKQILLGCLFVLLKFKIKEKDELLNILVNLFVFGILFGTLFNGLPQLAYRMKWYFFWTESVLVVYLVNYISAQNLRLTYLLYALLIFIYGYSLFTFLNDVASRGAYIFPYQFFF